MKEIPLTQGKMALVDDEDFDKVNFLRWHTHKGKNDKTYYAIHSEWTGSYVKKIRMSRLIMNPPECSVVDHIDGDGLNNQKSNLRIVSQRQNCQNRHQIKTSKFVGVTFDRWTKNKEKKWMATVVINAKQKMLGRFKTEEEAHEIYCNAIKTIGG